LADYNELARDFYEKLIKEAIMSTVLEERPKALAEPAGDEALYEVVNGQRVELPPMSIQASWIASRLQMHMGLFVEEHRLGWTVTESLFILDPEKDLRRRPDVAFVSAATWPLDRALPEEGDWEVVPDLAVEVISPTDLYERVLAKLREYFSCGVKQVWLISPGESQVHVYRSPDDDTILTLDKVLDGGTLLPGFQLPLTTLFQKPAEARA
jgi:Uma2 family endonuclease